MKNCLKFFSKKSVCLVGLTVLLILVSLLAIWIGSVRMSLSDVFSALWRGDPQDPYFRILVYMRIPRVLGVLLAGSALAVSGAMLQSVLDNGLASPGIIGVNAGGGLFSVLAAALFPTSLFAASFGAFLGALVAVTFVLLFAIKSGGARNTILLAGVAISSLFTALIDTVITLDPDLQLDRLAFSIGGFSGMTYPLLLWVLPLWLLGMVGSLFLGYDLNVLALGDETARGLGVRVGFVRGLAVVCVAFLSGSAIAIAGLLSFVGLIAPHMVAAWIGRDHRFLIPASALFGALLTMVCDLLARTIFTPYELPVGIFLSFLGVPFFLVLLLKRKKRTGTDGI